MRPEAVFRVPLVWMMADSHINCYIYEQRKGALGVKEDQHKFLLYENIG
jgi:hypothetical protein